MSVTPIDLNGETTYVFDGNGTFLTQLTALTTAKIGSKAIGPGMSEYKRAADGWVQTSFGGSVGVSVNRGVFFTPSSYSGNVEVNSITGMALATTATDAKVIRLTVAAVTGSPGALYAAFGTDSADAISNVNATAGSEAGMLLSLTPADGDTYEITIPANAQDGGVLAAGITGYVDTTNELVLNVTQGV